MRNDALKKLHTSLIDVRRGYDEAARDAETPELSRLFREMSDMHRAHHADVDAMLRAYGETPDEGGSLMTEVHKSVIAVRAAVTGLSGALGAFAGGEERVEKSYDEAIAGQSPGAARDTLMRHRAEVAAKAAALKTMADAR